MTDNEKKELKLRILEATIDEFNEKSLKFTMDDIAKRLSVSKKTIYQVISDKESLFLESVDYCFDAIKESEQMVLYDNRLTLVEKFKKILIVLPERYRNIDLRKIYGLKDNYPNIYKEIEKRLESGWFATLELLRQGIKQGFFRPISVPVFKSMVESSMNGFLSSGVLLENDISYEDALEEMLEILLRGIINE